VVDIDTVMNTIKALRDENASDDAEEPAGSEAAGSGADAS